MPKVVGVDLHKTQFTVCFKGEDGKEEIKVYRMDRRGIEEFKKRVDKDTIIGIESSINSDYFYGEIVGLVKRVVIINPSKFKVIALSLKKTDKIDARTIAEFLHKGFELPEVRYQSKEIKELKSLIQTRDKLVKLRTTLKNKLHGILMRNGIETKKEMFSSENRLEEIKDLPMSEMSRFEIGIITREIRELNKVIEEIEKKIEEKGGGLDGQESLRSITGIGKLSSTIILANIGDINEFENEKKLAAYAGLVPKVEESNGRRRDGRITKRGNKILRTVLVQVTLIAIRYNHYLRSFYLRLKMKKGSGKAIIATARKILGIIYMVLKNKLVFKNFNRFEFERV